MSKATANPLSALLLLALAGTGAWLWWDQRAERQQVDDHAQTEVSRFRQLPLALAVAHCHALWLQNHWDQAPLALAWQPGRLDWYVLDGTDMASMRHFSCTGAGFERGARFGRVLRERDPAPGGQSRNLLRDLNLFAFYAQGPADPTTVALEAAQDPLDPQGPAPIERRWSADGTGTTSGAAAADFPQLFSQRPPAPATIPFPALTRLTPNDWLKQPEAVFVLLGDHVPPDARVAHLAISSDRIDLTIRAQVPNLDGKPPAPFGDATFDEYGVRDADWWYPREDPSRACAVGHTLAEVRDLYLQHPSARRPDLLSARYSCNGKAASPTFGSWSLSLPRRRR